MIVTRVAAPSDDSIDSERSRSRFLCGETVRITGLSSAVGPSASCPKRVHGISVALGAIDNQRFKEGAR